MLGTTARRAFYRPREVADYFSVSDRSVHNWIKNGTVKALRVGRSWRIPAAEFDRLKGGYRVA